MENPNQPIKSPYFDDLKPNTIIQPTKIYSSKEEIEHKMEEFKAFVDELDVLIKKYKYNHAACFLFKEIDVDGRKMSQMQTAIMGVKNHNIDEIITFLKTKYDNTHN